MNLDSSYFVLAGIEPITHDMSSSLVAIFHSNIINITIVMFFLFWISRKMQIFSVISEKRNNIIQRIKNSEEEKRKAENELKATEKRLENSDIETQNIVKEAHKVAESLSDRIKKEAGTETQEIHKKTQRIIEAEKAAASNDVMHDISKAAFIIAEEHVKQAIDERLHRKYIDDFINDLDKMKV